MIQKYSSIRGVRTDPYSLAVVEVVGPVCHEIAYVLEIEGVRKDITGTEGTSHLRREALAHHTYAAEHQHFLLGLWRCRLVIEILPVSVALFKGTSQSPMSRAFDRCTD